MEDSIILLHEGIIMRYHSENEKRPQKHQLLIEFEDNTAVSVTVQMYAGIGCFKEGELDNKYYKIANEKPSPLSDKFDRDYYDGMISVPEIQKLSTKAFLATEQRIPGLGNGVQVDTLYILSSRMRLRKIFSCFVYAMKKAMKRLKCLCQAHIYTYHPMVQLYIQADH